MISDKILQIHAENISPENNRHKLLKRTTDYLSGPNY